MEAEQLRALQAPIKQRYRETPDAARVAARAEARLDPGRHCLCRRVLAWRGQSGAAPGGPAVRVTSPARPICCSRLSLPCAGVHVARGCDGNGCVTISGGRGDCRGKLGCARNVASTGACRLA